MNWGRLKNRPAFHCRPNSNTSPSCSGQKIKNDQYPNHFFKVLPSVNLFLLFFSPCQAWFYKPWKDPFLQTPNCTHSSIFSLFWFNLCSSILLLITQAVQKFFGFREWISRFLSLHWSFYLQWEGIGWEMLQEKERENNKEKDALIKYKK